ncbi:RNA polymerase sigma-54 factor [Rhizobium sp. SG_E_25_P2]|uniref:RNA polymerase factor sigma-54 n=1 Tax=Rhizobium sp. SG_E_25_P2 TaxID=2879942 RepID=UPI002474391B|nr:RNA polymerase factor sigma-54 [Rhizobium sp. SG_E_25_P2]MDH6264995.1 RNA polymerase sigma-54 factor [Rhizobium sp. SG_E_25_P2]
MALSASLLLRQTQSLVMTPQLMQSIQLLQMNFLELNNFIAQEVEKNPLLELATPANADQGDFEPQGFDGADGGRPPDRGDRSDDAPLQPSRAERLSEALDTGVENVFQDDAGPRKADAPELLQQWKSMPGGAGESSEAYDLDDFVAGQVTLKDHLERQIPFTITTATERLIARHLTDMLDENGYIGLEASELAERLKARPEDVAAVLAKLQELDPPGVYARSLAECLAIQLRLKNRLDPAMQALLANLELLARRDFSSLKKICGVDEEDLLDMLAEIRALDPKPGSSFESAPSESIIPDVIVKAAPDGGWTVEINPDTLPRVLVNQTYYEKVVGSVARQSADHAFLNECLQNANWLTRSLDQRAKTIMKVSTEIVRQQDAFFAQGIAHLRPLNLKTVAEAIKMHESTVSRVTSNKYMLTPRGLFELKYFFTVSLGSNEGGDAHSAESVRHRIKAMILEETADKILSDDDIVEALAGAGIEIARRTVAKYREAMNLPSSVQRRREKRAMAKAVPA